MCAQGMMHPSQRRNQSWRCASRSGPRVGASGRAAGHRDPTVAGTVKTATTGQSGKAQLAGTRQQVVAFSMLALV